MKTLDEAADDLDELASRADFARMRSVLERLAADLRTKDAAPWARVDLPAVFEADLDLRDPAQRGRILTRLRGVLILAPVLITWWGIYRAVQAYRGLLLAPQAERAPFVNQSFLQLWTTGFGGRTWWTLDSVALLDALAILLVIGVALLVDVRRHRAVRSDELLRAKAQGELRDVLLGAKLALAAAGYDAPDRLSQNVNELVPVYRATVGQMLAAQKEMASSLDQGKHIVAAMVQATENLRRAGADVATHAAEVGRQVGELDTRVGELDTRLTALVGGMTGLGTQVPEVNRGLQGVLDGVRDVGKRLQGVHDRQDAIVENLSVVTDVPLSAAQSAKRTAELALEAEARLRETVAALPQQMDRLRDGLLEAVDRELAERRSAADELVHTDRETRESAQLVRGAVDEIVTNLRRLVARLDDPAARRHWWDMFTRG